MTIDLTRVPFSAPGSFTVISDITQAVWNGRHPGEGLHLRTARAGHHAHGGVFAALRFMKNGREIAADYTATPWEIEARAEDGFVRICFDSQGRLRMLGRELDLLLYIYPRVSEEFIVFDADSYYLRTWEYDARWLFTRLKGTVSIEDPGLKAEDEPKSIRFGGPDWEAEIDQCAVVCERRASDGDYEFCAARARERFEAYAADVCAGGPEAYLPAMRQAAYVNRSAQVSDDGLLSGRVMLMSKNWMNSVWTWDCQFNAVECAGYDPEAAWDNFISPFRRQDATGVLLDMISDRCYSDACTKPPIHGWACEKLIDAGILDAEKMRWIYPRLLKWTESWYRHFDWDHDGICQYNHGNDSGWDNCSCFLCGAPVEGPDLSAYLVLCHEALARLADALGMPDKAREHRRGADDQLARLIAHSWDGERFRVCQSGSHKEKTDCDSLIAFLPILLGHRLPKEIFEKLAAGLKEAGRFLTPCGLATESLRSPYYISDGYWLGPIWAPAMMFIIEGLSDGGEKAFASGLARRFCDTCAREGFAENFDAETGKGLRDRAYTWTSSVFLTLARNYIE